jgi:hypothetical protein
MVSTSICGRVRPQPSTPAPTVSECSVRCHAEFILNILSDLNNTDTVIAAAKAHGLRLIISLYVFSSFGELALNCGFQNQQLVSFIFCLLNFLSLIMF